MEFEFRVMQASDLEDIFNFEETVMKSQIPDDMERMLAGWNSRARKEAIEHYVNTGWSFTALDKSGQIRGYYLGQALLFVEGQTQSLWIEHIRASDESLHFQLCEIAYKMGREKHLQRVYFPQDELTQKLIQNFKPQNPEQPIVFVKTTKG